MIEFHPFYSWKLDVSIDGIMYHAFSLVYQRAKFGPINVENPLTSLNWIKFNDRFFISGFNAEV